MTASAPGATTPWPHDYYERVYAGVLGKLIGVYLGRPFEQWSHESIVARWGEIRGYVHADCGKNLIVADDDITGTFTFVRALADHRLGGHLTSREIGQTWLNYIAEGRHILWWGGMGISTEHTAYLRLLAGIPAPESGSLARNGRAVAEEIGAQIFIDGWAMVSPGQPDQAARLAREAGRVSHDGEAVHAAAMLAAMEAAAFAQADIDYLIDLGLSFIPPDCEIARLTIDVRTWHRMEPDWKGSLRRLRVAYGYEKYGTNCPVQPNFGIILLALLYGAGDFDKSMMVANTAGYDTDCNAGNVGCLLGIRGGMAALTGGYDWRTPVNDRLYLPAADGDRGISDAATVAVEIINLGHRLAGREAFVPKRGARFHFDLPGATHGFAPTELCAPEAAAQAGTAADGERVLVLMAAGPDARADAETATFLMPEALAMPDQYVPMATPTLYPGQEIAADVRAGDADGCARLFVRAYHPGGGLALWEGPWHDLPAHVGATLRWDVPPIGAGPVATVGVEWRARMGRTLLLRRLTWSGQPELLLTPPLDQTELVPWKAAFAHNADMFAPGWFAPINFTKNRGTAILHTGARDWRDYEVAADLKPVLGDDFGLVARVQGLTRYYGLIASSDGRLRLVRMCHAETVLAETSLDWPLGRARHLTLRLQGNRLQGGLDGETVLEAVDADGHLAGGGAGWRVTTGRLESSALGIRRVQ